LSLISIVFLVVNIFLQHIIGFDIFGHPPLDKRYNGLFGSEAIAGGYIQKFSLISILSILLLKFSEKIKLFLTIIVINFLGLGILMSLDRMPLIVYVFSIAILTIFIKKFRLKFLTSLIIFFIFFQFLFNNYTVINNRYTSLVNEMNLSKIQGSFFNLNQKINIKASPNNSIGVDTIGLPDEYQYFHIYNSAYRLFLKKPFIGSGVKSFFTECYKLLKSYENASCSTHPHNIYLEILVNQGIIGFFIFIVFFIILLIRNFNFLLKKNTTEIKLLTIFFITILITELWPFRSYGSIFQTVNGSIFWFFLALVSSKPYIKKN
jgi:O-antigen ligase